MKELGRRTKRVWGWCTGSTKRAFVTRALTGFPGSAKKRHLRLRFSEEEEEEEEEEDMGIVAKVAGFPGFIFSLPKWTVPIQ